LGRNNFLKKTAIITFFIVAMSFLAAIIGSSGIAGGPDDLNGIDKYDVTAEQISNKLIRLHVIANSDSAEDQDLKICVRDQIINELGDELQSSGGIECSRKFIIEHLDYIEHIAREEVEKNGKNYNVKAVFGKFPFPVKSYGYVTLPAGEYEALRVIIGRGKGSNWWCVLFPPLCFVDITHGLTGDDVKAKLGKVLTAEELAAVETVSSPEEIPVKIRFKLVDWWHATAGKINKGMRIAFNKPW
jgi:stage II sporulation protein R